MKCIHYTYRTEQNRTYEKNILTKKKTDDYIIKKTKTKNSFSKISQAKKKY